MTSSKLNKKEIINTWKKFGDDKIISANLGIPEDFVSDYIEFNKIPKNIKNMIHHPYSLLRSSEIIQLIFRTMRIMGDGIQKKSDEDTVKLFNSLFKQFLQDSFEPLIHRSVQKRMVSENNGKSCPECDSKKQAEKINEIELEQPVSELIDSLSEKNDIELKTKYDPEWKCVDCGNEWRGHLITTFLDSDTI